VKYLSPGFGVKNSLGDGLGVGAAAFMVVPIDGKEGAL
jgi:hypothetical protein